MPLAFTTLFPGGDKIKGRVTANAATEYLITYATDPLHVHIEAADFSFWPSTTMGTATFRSLPSA